MQPFTKDTHPIIADYDADGYDYRSHWKNRAYEQWAEANVFSRLLSDIGEAQWIIDLGGGFGRNTIHYYQHAEHSVIVDYSVTNLQHAASVYRREIENGKIFLIRADLYHLPFVDGAFDVGLTIRVLHHMAEVESALKEMGRVIGQEWLLDVPIKHHIFARIRGLMHFKASKLSTWEPRILGNGETPFVSFHLSMVRQLLTRYGWDNSVVASVNNFRRWDQVLPAWSSAALRPLVYKLEKAAQRLGKGWWGPSQFVRATRQTLLTPQTPISLLPQAHINSPALEELATKMFCPACRAPLQWSRDSARCHNCARQYLRIGLIWDFVAK